MVQDGKFRSHASIQQFAGSLGVCGSAGNEQFVMDNERNACALRFDSLCEVGAERRSTKFTRQINAAGHTRKYNRLLQENSQGGYTGVPTP